MNLAEILEASAETHSDRAAVTDVRSGCSITYEGLGREAARVTTSLRAQGVEPGQRIGLLCPNGLAYLPAAFGLLGTGACLVPVPTNVTASEMADLLREVDVNACLLAPGAADGVLAGGEAQPLRGGECDGFTLQWVNRDAAGPAELRGLDPAFIRFTSGTTARSKGVVLSHAATVARVEAADHVLRFTPEDRILWVLPLAYHFAVTITAYVKAGAHILMCPDTLPRTVVEAIRHLEASVVYASPFHFERLGNVPSAGPFKSVRLALSTSAPITQPVMERFEAGYGVPVAQAYGIIEAGLPCINVRTDGLPATSVGRPVPGYEVAIVSETGERVVAGATGEVAVRGAGLFSAYYAPWQRREDITTGGWFLTGDIGRLDATGALYLEGRKKAVIFVAGVKFFPEEVEACINRFPGVKESRVMGHPHPRLGQVPHAEVALASASIDVDALRAHCTHLLSPYKVPLQFAIVGAVARTPGGKILRR
jgi:long-chain acyl-CoA synthetase